MNNKFDFNDIVLVPESLSNINSRKEINPYTYDAGLPLMVSPMDSVINKNNWNEFYNEGLMMPCIPRGEYIDINVVFNSMSLEEFELYLQQLLSGTWIMKNYHFILIDIANGHMERLHNAVKKFKQISNKEINTKLMVGNIANPKTYELFAQLGVDYVRCGIGGGSACTTSANTGVHYPMASLIQECYAIKKEKGYNTKIVADGGFKNYDDIIKALALGADYVMLGSILNKCLESSGDTHFMGLKITSPEILRFLWSKKSLRKYFTKSYRGMSTKEVQKKWNKKELKTAEGIAKINKIEYTIEQWRNNFEDYLRSAMSYCGARTLQEFKESEKVFITQNAFKRFHK